MNRRITVIAFLAIFTAALNSCGPSIKAPVLANGGKVKLEVLVDRNTDAPGLSDKQKEQRKQVGDWMENDIVRMANDAGFMAHVIKNMDEFNPGPDKYLLVVKITDYNPGSKAARMLVGFGAGAASLSTHSDLYKGKGQSVLPADHQVSSGRDWYFCVRALNQETLKQVASYLSSPE